MRALRQERGLCQEQLGNIAQLDRTYVSSCEAATKRDDQDDHATRGCP